ncbi:hypothetical protein EVAR_30895_1 [Eumeta japonica]|uniref:Uncharacterized protein n=1 Tax=Eumeta variegata TaxID=151549 RepID=A0A4C1V4V7_EUMVA|nr:hypothetical protein EVAR_30895_1 [Eumeta japonica]
MRACHIRDDRCRLKPETYICEVWGEGAGVCSFVHVRKCALECEGLYRGGVFPQPALSAHRLWAPLVIVFEHSGDHLRVIGWLDRQRRGRSRFPESGSDARYVDLCGRRRGVERCVPLTSATFASYARGEKPESS